MPAVQLKRHETIVTDIIGRIVSSGSLSDVADSSQWKGVVAGVAREIDEVYFQLTRLRDLMDLLKASGEDLDERAAEIQPGTLTRIAARRAIGTVQFSRTGTSGTITIPAGTVVKTEDGKSFATTLQGQILDTQSVSELVSIQAQEVGSGSNVGGSLIIRFGSKPTGVDAVTNTTATTQGRDEESDDAFRGRILTFVASLSRCPVDALEALVLGATDPISGKVVSFAKAIEDIVDRGNVTMYIDDGAGTAAELGTPIVGETVISPAVGGEEFLFLASAPMVSTTLTLTSNLRGTLVLGTDFFLNPANGQLKFSPTLAATEAITASYTPYTNLIPHIQKLVDGDAADRSNFPGFRAAGVRVLVQSPTIISVAVEAVLTVARSASLATAQTDAQNAVLEYINNVGISGDIIRHELVERIMGVNGVTDVDLTVPAANVTILDDQLPRSTTANINIT